MTTEHVKHGETFTLSGTLGASETLIGLTGDPGALILVSATAENRGTIQLTGAASAHKQGATLNDTGVLTNLGLVTVQGGTNSTHAALLQVNGVLTNHDTLAAQAGLYGAGAQITIGGSGLLRNDSRLTLAGGLHPGSAGATLGDTGALFNAASGTIDVAGGMSILEVNGYGGAGASIAVSGTFTNHGVLNIYDGYQSIATNAGGTVSVSGVMNNAGSMLIGDMNYEAQGSALLSISGSLANTGSIYVTGAPTGYQRSGGVRSILAVSGTLTNQGQITLQAGGIGGSEAVFGQGGLLLDTGTVTNIGTVLIGGAAGGGAYFANPITGGTIVVDGVLTNTGTITDQQNSGLVVVGTVTNEASLTANGGSSFYYIQFYPSSGGLISVSGTLNNSGNIALNGGVSGAAVPAPFTTAGGGGAHLDITGSASNTGRIVVGGGGGGYPSVGGYSIGTGATLSVATATSTVFGLVNSGTIEIQQGGTSTYGVYGSGGLLIDSSSLYDKPFSVITIDGGKGSSTGELQVTAGAELSLSGTIDGTGVLLNQGGLRAFYHSAITGVAFINDGTAFVGYQSALSINAALTSDAGKSGLLLISDRGTLELGSSVAASQTILFQGTSAMLNLASLSKFSGTLSGVAATDVIDFLKQDVITATTTGDTLALTLSTGTTVDLALAAPLSGLLLTLQSDGHKGTDLLFSAPLPPAS